ncbi:MAG: GLUG motif-containing protein, partial [Planctomycetota bacterium]
MPKTQEYRSVSPEFAGLWSISTTATLLFLMLAGAGAAHAYDFAGGSGEPNDPYQIATAEQLVSIGADPNLLDKSFVLIADLDLDPNLPGRRIFTRALIAPDVFAPDGSPLPGFAGGFDGNGHALTNLTINGPQEYAVGLFGSVDQSAKVRNLKIKGANIIGGRASGIIGILAGCNCGTISSCCAIGQVTGPADLGGLVGQNAGTIRSCYATVHIRATGLSVAKGGLVGWNFGHVVNCYSTGSVLDESTWVAFVGGVAGHSMVLVDVVQVTDCFWDATIGDVSTGQEASGSSLAPLGGWGLGLTTAQMMDPNTYALNGWADDPNWVLDDGNDYPRLAWEGTPGQPIPAPAIDWFEGAGTPDDPYLVATAEQLARIGTASILWDNSFLLICDVNLAGTNFTPIGHCFGTHFRGVFDGDTRVVSNLTIDGRETARLFSLGMFGYVGPEGSVRRLALRDAQIRCDGPTSNAGVLAGTNDGTITHCSAGGVIFAGDTATAMGGLVGFCAGTIANCEATSDVVPGANSWALGGLVGALGGDRPRADPGALDFFRARLDALKPPGLGFLLELGHGLLEGRDSLLEG